MMYILKFILLWFLPPGCIVLLLAAFTVYMFKHKIRGRSGLALITLLLYFASLMPVAQILTHGLEGRYMQPANDVKADVIAVLGGGTVSNVGGNNDGALSAIGMNRLIAGARLQKAMNVPLIISGGTRYNDEVAEADVAKQVLLDLCTPEQMIYTDSEALNTKQNAENIIFDIQFCRLFRRIIGCKPSCTVRQYRKESHDGFLRNDTDLFELGSGRGKGCHAEIFASCGILFHCRSFCIGGAGLYFFFRTALPVGKNQLEIRTAWG